MRREGSHLMIVDDQESIRSLCASVAASVGLTYCEAENGAAALEKLDIEVPDLVLTDLRMPQMSGLDFLSQLKTALPHTEVAIMTGHGSIESAVQAMRLGAYDYITKPFRMEELKLLLQRMREKAELVSENLFLRECVRSEMELQGIVGSSARMQELLRMVARLKETRTPVLISGESGTGKELVARAIHFWGPNAKRPFIPVDCGALAPTLIESELFGHERGAFTGAVKSKPGLFEAAEGGTLFFDEIGELPLEMQAKLLRALQEKEVRRVGSNTPCKVDVRIIAASNRDLEVAYQGGTFRKDLYFRLNVVSLHLPPLRERKGDIPALVHRFLDKFSTGHSVAITSAAMQSMLQYDWPGNVRELENSVQRALALGGENVIDEHDLPPAMRRSRIEVESEFGVPLLSSTDLEELERETILRVFEQTHGDKALTGKMLGISRATLYRKLKRYNISGDLRASAAAQN